MKRQNRAAVFVAFVIALLVALTGTAQGQDDGPAIALSGDDITVTEEGDETTYSVEDPGTYDVTITGSDFSIQVFVLQCPGAGGSVEVITDGDPTTLCDLGNLQAAVPDGDGAFEVSFEAVEIDDCGLIFAAGDTDQTEAAVALLSVVNADPDAECEVVESEGYDEDVANTGQDAEVAGATQTNDDSLANTGLNSIELAIIATIVLLAGWLVAHETRRMPEKRPTR